MKAMGEPTSLYIVQKHASALYTDYSLALGQVSRECIQGSSDNLSSFEEVHKTHKRRLLQEEDHHSWTTSFSMEGRRRVQCFKSCTSSTQCYEATWRLRLLWPRLHWKQRMSHDSTVHTGLVSFLNSWKHAVLYHALLSAMHVWAV
jgi:hypothetical protein